jgi:hypothetical protein
MLTSNVHVVWLVQVDVESRLRAAIDHNKRIKGEQQQDGGDDLDKE